jgi:hypothetical protein
MSGDLNNDLFSKNYNDFEIFAADKVEEPASKILNIDLRNIPYALFTKNYSDLSTKEAFNISRYFANVMYLLDAVDISDKKGIAYISELFAFKCSNIKLGVEISATADEIKAMIADNYLAGLAYDMSGCNGNNYL